MNSKLATVALLSMAVLTLGVGGCEDVPDDVEPPPDAPEEQPGD